VKGDVNNDGDVDLDDYLQFGLCITGPDMESVGAEADACLLEFSSDDADVDLADFAAFQVLFTGPFD
jgi:hypothetical protein